MMKRAGQVFDVLLAVLVVNKVFVMACTAEQPQKNNHEASIDAKAHSGSIPEQKSLEAIPLEKVKNQ